MSPISGRCLANALRYIDDGTGENICFKVLLLYPHVAFCTVWLLLKVSICLDIEKNEGGQFMMLLQSSGYNILATYIICKPIFWEAYTRSIPSVTCTPLPAEVIRCHGNVENDN